MCVKTSCVYVINNDNNINNNNTNNNNIDNNNIKNNMPIVVYCIFNNVSVQMHCANGVRVHAHGVICSNTNGSCVTAVRPIAQ